MPTVVKSHQNGPKLSSITLLQEKEIPTIYNNMSKIFHFEILTSLSGNLNMLHFDANPIRHGYLYPIHLTLCSDVTRKRSERI